MASQCSKISSSFRGDQAEILINSGPISIDIGVASNEDDIYKDTEQPLLTNQTFVNSDRLDNYNIS